MSAEERLNEFFVSCFYSILNAEEKALAPIIGDELTLNEIHVIDAVVKAQKSGENTFATVAKLLNITSGTLTTAFNKLEKKGCLTKEQNPDDRRVFYIIPTPRAELINNAHTEFHKKMVSGIVKRLPKNDLDNLSGALKVLYEYFNEL